MNRYFGIASFVSIGCFLLQVFLLGMVFKNIRLLAFTTRKPYILAFVVMIVTMVIVNNFILPANATADETARVMLLMFNVLTFITLLGFHFVVNWITENAHNK